MCTLKLRTNAWAYKSNIKLTSKTDKEYNESDHHTNYDQNFLLKLHNSISVMTHHPFTQTSYVLKPTQHNNQPLVPSEGSQTPQAILCKETNNLLCLKWIHYPLYLTHSTHSTKESACSTVTKIKVRLN